MLLIAYANGLFPMAETAESPELFWMDPPERCIFPLENFHVPRRLEQTVKQNRYRITINQCFDDVIAACAAKSEKRQKTWINADIIRLYTQLHKEGHAHSLEAWKEDQLVGGLYGISMGRAFFGESMFSTARDASKVALVHCAARLIKNGYRLFDAQFENGHLTQFGCSIIPRESYLRFLALALSSGTASFAAGGSLDGGAAIGFLQSSTQTS